MTYDDGHKIMVDKIGDNSKRNEFYKFCVVEID